MTSDRQALEKIAALGNEAGANELATRMTEIAEAQLAMLDLLKLEVLCKGTFVQLAEDHLSSIQAAAEPVRKLIRDAVYRDRIPVLLFHFEALLDAIGKSETARNAPGANDTPRIGESASPPPSVALEAPGLAGILSATHYQHYYSTYCIHNDHEHCRKTCKTCKAPCLCECHEEPVK